MPIIPVVGRRGWKLRFTLTALYLLVAVGAVTVMYPFLLMVSSGSTSDVDFNDFRVVPKYLRDDGDVYRKYTREKYAEGIRCDGMMMYPLQELGDRYGEVFYTARDVDGWYVKDANGEDTKTPMFDGNDPRVRRRVTDYNEFRSTLKPDFFNVCMVGVTVLPGKSWLEFGRTLERRYKNVDAVNLAYGDTFTAFFPGGLLGSCPAPAGDLLLRPDWWASGSIDEERIVGTLDEPVLLRQMDWYAFKSRTRPEWRQTLVGRFDYQRFLLRKVNLVPEDDEAVKRAALKKRYGFSLKKTRDLPLPGSLPTNPVEAGDWEEFVRTMWSPRFVRATGGGDLFISYLKNRYNTIEKVNKAWGTNFASFESEGVFASKMLGYLPEDVSEIGGPSVLANNNAVRDYRKLARQVLSPRFQRTVEWAAFVRNRLPAKYIHVIDPEELYREFLIGKYGSLDAVNKNHGASYATVNSIFPPYRETDFIEVFDDLGQLRWEFATRNFTAVINFIVVKGRAALNTLILVLLTVGTHLTVSPIAAFVLSRFRLRYTYKVLLFLIATMAFPAEVASIPSFLLMKKLHLFNTYWALVLPGLANGFGIFILKSFFDSLPEELFEAARMDGAGELRQLWNVAVPLIKPILAINALGSFTAAYGGFMWAYLVCRKEEMWTLMVYLFQFQTSAGSDSIMMAALVLASLPTLLIFVFCQQIILRGIILPQFK